MVVAPESIGRDDTTRIVTPRSHELPGTDIQSLKTSSLKPLFVQQSSVPIKKIDDQLLAGRFDERGSERLRYEGAPRRARGRSGRRPGALDDLNVICGFNELLVVIMAGEKYVDVAAGIERVQELI